jgi:hypothetical protein
LFTLGVIEGEGRREKRREGKGKKDKKKKKKREEKEGKLLESNYRILERRVAQPLDGRVKRAESEGKGGDRFLFLISG